MRNCRNFCSQTELLISHRCGVFAKWCVDSFENRYDLLMELFVASRLPLLCRIQSLKLEWILKFKMKCEFWNSTFRFENVWKQKKKIQMYFRNFIFETDSGQNIMIVHFRIHKNRKLFQRLPKIMILSAEAHHLITLHSTYQTSRFKHN